MSGLLAPRLSLARLAPRLLAMGCRTCGGSLTPLLGLLGLTPLLALLGLAPLLALLGLAPLLGLLALLALGG